MEIVKAFNKNELNQNITIKGTYDNPLFRASDIAEILNISNIRQATTGFDEESKIIISNETIGGIQNVIFLTEKGLYKLLFKSRKPIAEIFQNWVCEIIKEIRLTGKYELEQQLKQKDNEIKCIKDELQQKENELCEIKIKEKIPMIYIFNTDTNKTPPELKIGYTTNLYTRIKPYKQTHKNGKLEFSIELQDTNIKVIENFIHELLKNYRLKDEIFILHIDEAKIIILNIINLLNLTKITNKEERTSKLLKTFEIQNNIINNHNICISKKTIECQTDNNLIKNFDNKNENNNDKKYKKFIDEMCIIHPNVEVSSSKIKGLYRLWLREANRENTEEITDYLNTNYKYIRLKEQNCNKVIMGYKGITIKEQIYQKSIIRTDVEDFIFQKCTFIPDGTSLMTDLVKEYCEWKICLNKQTTNTEKDEIKNYFKTNNNVLFETVWTINGNGQGYYGIILNSYKNIIQKNTTTGKTVKKIDINTNICIDTWNTIHKASISEQMSSAKMSRIIKNKTIIDNNYMYIVH